MTYSLFWSLTSLIYFFPNIELLVSMKSKRLMIFGFWALIIFKFSISDEVRDASSNCNMNERFADMMGDEHKSTCFLMDLYAYSLEMVKTILPDFQMCRTLFGMPCSLRQTYSLLMLRFVRRSFAPIILALNECWCQFYLEGLQGTCFILVTNSIIYWINC